MIPKLRFPEFNCSWEKLELSQAFDYFNGKAHEQFIDNEGSYILVNSKFISTEGQTFKRTNQQIFPLQKDDICMVLSDVPNGKAIAKCFYISQNNTYTLNQRICALRNRNFVIPKYAFYVINRNNYFLQFDSGVGQTNLRKSDVLDFTFNAPDIEEQKKIASVLTTLDQKINLLTKKKEALETYKKGLMQKIFSQELRFKREDGSDFGNWESALLGDLCTIKTGKLDANAQREDGEYPFYTCSREVYRTDTYSFNGEALTIAGNGDVGIMHFAQGKFNAYQRTYVLQKFRVNRMYLKYFLEKYLPIQVKRELNVGAMPYIVQGTLKTMPVHLPSDIEMRKIGDMLFAFDRGIDTVSIQINKMTELKKGLLQQMFV